MKNKIYYTLRPIVPRKIQLYFRRKVVNYKKEKHSKKWPIDPDSATSPEGWKGWPQGKRFALILSHDVDTQKGHDSCLKMLEIESSLGFKSSVNLVPEKYRVSKELIKEIKSRGCEVCVHGLCHDGKLFYNEEIFFKRAEKINCYLKEWESKGFTSPSMHHNLSWMHRLNIQHAISTFDTDPFEPQPDSIGTIFPVLIRNNKTTESYIEMPYTLPQDHLLFIIMQEKNIDIWKRKLDWIVEKGGMALLNTHSDYMNFTQGKLMREEYPVKYYVDFLEYVKTKYNEEYFHVLPGDLAQFWKENAEINK